MSASDDFTYKVKNDFYLQYNEISGNRPSSSTLTNDLIYYNLFSIYDKEKFRDIDYKVNIGESLANSICRSI